MCFNQHRFHVSPGHDRASKKRHINRSDKATKEELIIERDVMVHQHTLKQLPQKIEGGKSIDLLSDLDEKIAREPNLN